MTSVITEDKSLFIFAPDSGLRRGCNYLIDESTIYSAFLLFTTIVNSIILVLEQPRYTVSTNMPDGLVFYVEIACLSIFTLDLLLRAVAKGIILHKGSMLRDFWSVFRLLIVTVAFISIFSGTSLSALLALLPLQAVSQAKGLRTLNKTVVHAAPMIFASVICLTLFVAIFGLIGVELWATDPVYARCSVDVWLPTLSNASAETLDEAAVTPNTTAMRNAFEDALTQTLSQANFSAPSDPVPSIVTLLDALSTFNGTNQDNRTEFFGMNVNTTLMRAIWYPFMSIINRTDVLKRHGVCGSGSTDNGCEVVRIDDPFDPRSCGGMHTCAAPFVCMQMEPGYYRKTLRTSVKHEDGLLNPHVNTTDTSALTTLLLRYFAEKQTPLLVDNTLYGAGRKDYEVRTFRDFLRSSLRAFIVISRDSWIRDFERSADTNGPLAFPYFILLSLLGRYFLLNTFLCVLLCEMAVASDALKEEEANARKKQEAEELARRREERSNSLIEDEMMAAEVEDDEFDINKKVHKDGLSDDDEDKFFKDITNTKKKRTFMRSFAKGFYYFLDKVIKPLNYFFSVINILLLCGYYYGIDETAWFWMKRGSWICVGFVPIEILLRLLSMGPIVTVKSIYNWVDLIVVLNAVFEFLNDHVNGIGVLRGFRLFEGLYRSHKNEELDRLRDEIADEKRAAKIDAGGWGDHGKKKKNKGPVALLNLESLAAVGKRKVIDDGSRPLRPGGPVVRVAMLFYALMPAIFTIMKVLGVLLIFMFTYAVIGMQLFGNLTLRDANGVELRTNFYTLWDSGFTLFIIVMGEWTEVFFAVAEETDIVIAIFYFLSFVLLNMFVFLNMIASVVYNRFDEVVTTDWSTELYFLNKESKKEDMKPPRMFMQPISLKDIVNRQGSATGEVVDKPVVDRRQFKWPSLMFRDEAKSFDKRRMIVLQGRSFMIFGPSNPIRRALAMLMFSWGFGVFTHTVTFFNVVLLTIESTPTFYEALPWEEDQRANIFRYSGFCFAGIFWTEVIIKCIVLGVFGPPGESLRKDGVLPGRMSERQDIVYKAFFLSGPNILSVLIAAAAVLASAGFQIFSTLRSLRTISFVLRFNGVRVAAMSLAKSLPYIMRMVVMGVFAWVFAATIGVHLFAGSLSQCNDPAITVADQCVGSFIEWHPISEGHLRDQVRQATTFGASVLEQAFNVTIPNVTDPTVDQVLGQLSTSEEWNRVFTAPTFDDATNTTRSDVWGLGIPAIPTDYLAWNNITAMLSNTTVTAAMAAVVLAAATNQTLPQLEVLDNRTLALMSLDSQTKLDLVAQATANQQIVLNEPVLVAREWKRAIPTIGFNHLGEGMLSVFIVSTGQQIRDFIYLCTDSVGRDKAIERSANPVLGVYAVAICILGIFFIINAFIGVPYTYFMKFRKLHDGSLYLDEKQQVYYLAQSVCRAVLFLIDNSERPTNALRGLLFDMITYTPGWLHKSEKKKPGEKKRSGVNSPGITSPDVKSPRSDAKSPSPEPVGSTPTKGITSPREGSGENPADKDDSKQKKVGGYLIVERMTLFDLVAALVIVLYFTFQIISSTKVVDLEFIQRPIDVAVNAIMSTEVMIRLLALGPFRFWTSKWNRYDLFVALVGIFELVLLTTSLDVVVQDSFGEFGFDFVNRLFSFSTILRTARIIKPLRRIHRVQKFYALIGLAASGLMDVVVLFIVCLFISGLLAFDLFGRLAYNGALSETNNFETLPNAMLVLFRITSLSEWPAMMEACSVRPPNCDPSASGKEYNQCGQQYTAIPFFVLFALFIGLFMVQLCISVVVDTFWEMEKIAAGRSKIFEIFNTVRLQWVTINLADPDRESMRQMNVLQLCKFVRRLPAEYLDTLGVVNLGECTRRARTEAELREDERWENADDDELITPEIFNRKEGAVEEDNNDEDFAAVADGGSKQKITNVQQELDIVLSNVQVLRIINSLHLTVDYHPISGQEKYVPPARASKKEIERRRSVHMKTMSRTQMGLENMHVNDDDRKEAAADIDSDTDTEMEPPPPQLTRKASTVSIVSTPDEDDDSQIALFEVGAKHAIASSFYVRFESMLFSMIRAWSKSSSPPAAVAHLPIHSRIATYDDAYPKADESYSSGGVAYGGSNLSNRTFTAAHVLAARFIWMHWKRFLKLRANNKLMSEAEREEIRQKRLDLIKADLAARNERLVNQKRELTKAEQYLLQKQKDEEDEEVEEQQETEESKPVVDLSGSNPPRLGSPDVKTKSQQDEASTTPKAEERKKRLGKYAYANSNWDKPFTEEDENPSNPSDSPPPNQPEAAPEPVAAAAAPAQEPSSNPQPRGAAAYGKRRTSTDAEDGDDSSKPKPKPKPKRTYSYKTDSALLAAQGGPGAPPFYNPVEMAEEDEGDAHPPSKPPPKGGPTPAPVPKRSEQYSYLSGIDMDDL